MIDSSLPLDQELLTDVDRAWLAEVETRQKQVKLGEVSLVPLADALESAKKELGWEG